MMDVGKQLLISIALYTPPKAGRVAAAGDRTGEGGSIIGGSPALAQEEDVSLEERHERACRFVSVVHR